MHDLVYAIAFWGLYLGALYAAWRRFVRRGPRAKLAETERAKDAAYSERNKLVALVASVFPARLVRHADDDTEWEDDWRWIVSVQLPTGQATWHIHDSELTLFAHVARGEQVGEWAWDGHTTDEKYERVLDAARSSLEESGDG